MLIRQEKVSEEYLKEHGEVKTVDEGTLSRLMEMVKNDDEIFMSAFHNSFPAFLEKLRVIHPAIVPSEIEFCALLKLNLSTKDIARYKNIEPKSVQNKKYRIRKKLNIPDDVDIYFWFNKF
ncbi:MAG: LuxR C-terminal-related transcriptional regulator [Flavobacterium sp. JAD_PAG50586_2]|nr:MAG: LuxR C-terminal-related transcriptional regulator [Flavobacterium sp. JAD_PAG50586_2]